VRSSNEIERENKSLIALRYKISISKFELKFRFRGLKLARSEEHSRRGEEYKTLSIYKNRGNFLHLSLIRGRET